MSGTMGSGSGARTRDAVLVLFVVLLTAACVQLGLGRVARLRETQRANRGLRAALAAPPLELGAVPPSLESVRDRRVSATGIFDESRQLLLEGRARQGETGVKVITPLRLAGGGAVLVDRGWLAGPAATAMDPAQVPEPGARVVVGLPRPLAPAGRRPLVRLEAPSACLWSVRDLGLDSLAACFPYALAPYVIQQAPGPGVPEKPLRLPVEPGEEGAHRWYAMLWFALAVLLPGGSAALAWGRPRWRS